MYLKFRMDHHGHSITFSAMQVAETSAIILAVNIKPLSALQHVLTTFPLAHAQKTPEEIPLQLSSGNFLTWQHTWNSYPNQKDFCGSSAARYL